MYFKEILCGAQCLTESTEARVALVQEKGTKSTLCLLSDGGPMAASRKLRAQGFEKQSQRQFANHSLSEGMSFQFQNWGSGTQRSERRLQLPPAPRWMAFLNSSLPKRREASVAGSVVGQQLMFTSELSPSSQHSGHPKGPISSIAHFAD